MPNDAKKLDPRLLATLYGEVGSGSPEEVQAVASVILNRVDRQGLEGALQGFSAFSGRSPEFRKALTGKMTEKERLFFNRNANILSDIVANPEKRLPYTHLENVDAFGDPYWSVDATSFKDIGRQRFYIIPQNPRGSAVQRQETLALQQALKKEGFNPGQIDGILGPRTRRAVVSFQRARNLVPDGIVGPKTRGALFTPVDPSEEGVNASSVKPLSSSR